MTVLSNLFYLSVLVYYQNKHNKCWSHFTFYKNLISKSWSIFYLHSFELIIIKGLNKIQLFYKIINSKFNKKSISNVRVALINPVPLRRTLKNHQWNHWGHYWHQTVRITISSSLDQWNQRNHHGKTCIYPKAFQVPP